MANSSLVSVVVSSPNNSGTRTMKVDRISPHCVVGQMSAAGLGAWFAKTSTQASSNYGIGYDGKIGLYVDESKRSWCTSSSANDQRAITIECASATTAPYTMNTAVYDSLIKLCVDICKRYGKKKLIWINDKAKALAYTPAADEMLITVHRWFANKSCPGDWLYSRLGDLAQKVTSQLKISSAVSDVADTAKETAASTKLAGKSILLSGVPLYVSSTATSPASYITGTYYYWDSTVTNKRIRITNSKDKAGVAGQVTGWIDAPSDTASSSASTAPATQTTTTVKAGQAIFMKDVPIYSSSSATKYSKTVTGTYYLWSVQVINNRIRITNSTSRVGVSGQVTGWVDVKYVGLALTEAKKSVLEVAKEVIAGKWGNGTERKKKLEAAGYNYNEVQAKVNELLKK